MKEKTISEMIHAARHLGQLSNDLELIALNTTMKWDDAVQLKRIIDSVMANSGLLYRLLREEGVQNPNVR